MVSAATLISTMADFTGGWCVWSLSHNLGHRWWHDEMRKGKQTFYAHGEREHHRVYDTHGLQAFRHNEDPKELFISFPLWVVAPVGLIFVAAYGMLRGWTHCLPFAVWMYSCMVIDHQLHILFHKAANLPGILGWFQQMHFTHHSTHRHNYFFVSGLIWDVLMRTARTKPEHKQPILAGCVLASDDGAIPLPHTRHRQKQVGVN